jgi:hypothetical protein
MVGTAAYLHVAPALGLRQHGLVPRHGHASSGLTAGGTWEEPAMGKMDTGNHGLTPKHRK